MGIFMCAGGVLFLLLGVLVHDSKATTDNCPSGPIDAITTACNGRTYAFVGRLVYDVTYPLTIPRAQLNSDVFSNLPHDFAVNAAFTHPNDNRTYIFGGSEFYRYTCDGADISPETGSPYAISDFNSKLPNDLDSIFLYVKGNGQLRLYATKGNKYWRFNTNFDEIDSKYPKTFTSIWKGLPSPVNAATMYGADDKTYFFKDNTFYGRTRGENDQYGARDVSIWWFKCCSNP